MKIKNLSKVKLGHYLFKTVSIALIALSIEHSLFGQTKLFVAPTGNDTTGNGSEATPFATPGRALKSVAELKKQGLPDGGVVITVKKGIYSSSESLLFDESVSGEPGKPIVLTTPSEDRATLSGAINVTPESFQPVTDPAYLKRIHPNAKGKVVVLNLAQFGAKNIGPWPVQMRENTVGVLEVLIGGKRMPISRYPNKGFMRISEVTEIGTEQIKPRFIYKDTQIEKWDLSGGLWLHGWWRVEFTSDILKVDTIDKAKKEVTLAGFPQLGIGDKFHRPNKTTGKIGSHHEPFYALNVIEEIDLPGEWAIDFKAKLLFIYPTDDFKTGGIELNDSNNPVISIVKGSDITISGFYVTTSMNAAVSLQNAVRVNIEGCEVVNAMTGIYAYEAFETKILSCDIHEITKYGIHMKYQEDRKDPKIARSENAKKLISDRNVIENNNVYHCFKGMIIGGKDEGFAVGTKVIHNYIHDVGDVGVFYGGNDILFEFNEVHNIALSSGDSGAFYSTLRITDRGNILRHNLVHNAPGINAFYIDDGECGNVITGNIVYKSSVGGWISGGGDNHITNNIFIECDAAALHIDDRGVSRGYGDPESFTGTYMYKIQLKSVDYLSPPWSLKYPSMVQNILKFPGLPVSNTLGNCVIIDCKEELRKKGKPENLIHNTYLPNLTEYTLKEFVNAEKLDFNYAKGSSLAKQKGFQIPVNKIGLYTDKYRKALPLNDPGRFISKRTFGQVDASEKDLQASNEKEAAARGVANTLAKTTSVKPISSSTKGLTASLLLDDLYYSFEDDKVTMQNGKAIQSKNITFADGFSSSSRAAQFQGSGSVSGAVVVYDKKSQLTISFWYKGKSQNRTVVVGSTSDFWNQGGGKPHFSIYADKTGEITALITPGDKTPNMQLRIPASLDDKWHHFAYVKNGDESRVYLDGVEKKKGNIPFAIPDGYELEIAVGSAPNGLGGFTGLLDEVYLLPRAISVEEVVKLSKGEKIVVSGSSGKSGSVKKSGVEKSVTYLDKEGKEKTRIFNVLSEDKGGITFLIGNETYKLSAEKIVKMNSENVVKKSGSKIDEKIEKSSTLKPAGSTGASTVIAQEELDYEKMAMLPVPEIKEIPPAEALEVNVRAGLPNFYARAAKGEKLTVAYFGGSITAHEGWRPQTFAWLEENFPKAKLTMIQAAVGGTGSIIGAFRCDTDLIKHRPDLVFVEFAVNDGGDAKSKHGEVLRAMEGIVRKVKAANSLAELVFVYTLQGPDVQTIQAGQYHHAARVHEVIARHYNIPSIHMGVELTKMIAEGKAVFRGPANMEKTADGKLIFTEDNTHPTIPHGHAVYAEAVKRSFPKLKAVPDKSSTALVAPLFPDNWQLAKTLPAYDNGTFEGTWEKLTVDNGPKGFRYGAKIYDWFPYLMRTDDTSATFTLRFKGTYFGVKGMHGKDSGFVDVVVDGKPYKVEKHFTVYNNKYFYSGLTQGPLPYGDHVVTFKISSEKPDKKAILASYYRAGNADDLDKNPKEYEPIRFSVGEIMIIGTVVPPVVEE